MTTQTEFIGMDLDSDARDMAPGYTRENSCCVIFNPSNKALGTVTNIRGNKLVSNTLLPSGTNICNGAFEDKKGGRIFYFVYNSNNTHSIFEYDVSGNTIDLICQGSILGFDINRLIYNINLLDDLLKWSDSPNPPYEINVARGNNRNKKISINLYFGDPTDTSPFFNGANFVLSLGATSGVPSISSTYNFSVDRDFQTGLAEYAAILQAAVTFGGDHYTITNNGLYLNLTGKTAFIVTCSASTSNSVYWKVFQNTYTGSLSQMYLDVIKYPPHHPIIPTLKKDSTRATNLISGKVFQFRYRYIYNELQHSRFSEWSDIALDANLSEHNLLDTAANFISLNYLDNSLLTSANYRQMIKRVEITLKEGNTGNEFSFIVLEQHQLTGTYKFYNDINRLAIDAASSVALYDPVPLDSKAQDADQEVFYANNREGYDEVQLNVAITQTVDDLDQPNMWQITGRMKINNKTTGTVSPTLMFKKGDPTYKPDTLANPDNGTEWVYGYDTNEAVQGQLGADMFQFAPSGGFIVYAAGTPYYSVTRQTGVGQHDFTLAPNGLPEQNNSLKLPPGKWIIRWASPLCNHGSTRFGNMYNLDNYNLSWQKTSMPLHWCFGGISDTSAAVYEMEIELDDTGGVVDLRSALPAGCIIHMGGNTYNPGSSLPNSGDSFTYDLTEYSASDGVNQSTAIYGYLLDNNGSSAAGDIGPEDLRIEGQQIEGYDVVESVTFGSTIYTDHNGFFWLQQNLLTPLTSEPHVAIKVTGGNTKILKDNNETFWSGSLDGSLTASPLDGGTGYYYVQAFLTKGLFTALYAHNMTELNKLKTVVWSEVVNQLGNPIQNELVILTRNGNFVYPPAGTGADGRVGITCYMMTVAGETPPGRVNDVLLVGKDHQTYNAIIIPTFASYGAATKIYSSTVFFIAQQGSTADKYPSSNPNPTSPSTAYTPFVITSPITHLSAFKRGGRNNFGIVYFDRGQRSTAICNDPALNVYFPAQSEDLSKTISGYSPGTYKFGQPQLTWSISHAPPTQFTHYAWYCTDDLVYQNLIQIVANSALYLLYFDTNATDPLDQKVAYGDPRAKSVYIDITTLLYYSQRNPGSRIAYTFQAGDRLRIITNSNGEYQTGTLYDVEIKGSYVKDGVSYIYIDALDTLPEISQGVLLELYTPKLLNENNLFYALCSEVYDLYTDSNGNWAHKGPLVNQVVGTTPASGKFANGDTYFRQRFMTSVSGTGSTAYNYFIEDFNISDFADSRSWSKGRPNVINKDFHQARRYDNIRFSNLYISRASNAATSEIEATLNGSSSFEVLNNKDSKNSFGAITRIIVKGLDLFIIQENGCVGAYLNVNAIKDQSGTNLISLSDQVINQMRPELQKWGCTDPSSACEKNGRVYYYNRQFGIPVRFSQNGHTDISDKCKSRFSKISDDLKAGATSVRISSAYDEYRGLWSIAFSYTLSAVDYLYVMDYNERKNTWTSSWPYKPDILCSLGKGLASFSAGDIYKHNDPTVNCNTFYGVFYKQKFVFVFNEGGKMVKTLGHLDIQSNVAWDVPKILLPADELNASGYESELLSTDMELKEGIYHGNFLRNKNTPNMTTGYPLINGDVLRGETAELQMENSSTTDTILFGINVSATPSNFIE